VREEKEKEQGSWGCGVLYIYIYIYIDIYCLIYIVYWGVMHDETWPLILLLLTTTSPKP